MDRLTLLTLGMIAIAPCACSATTVAQPTTISIEPRLARWQENVTEASQRFAIPESWIYAVMNLESNGETMLDGRPTVSKAGAMGLMQVMPGTYKEMRLEHDLGPDPHEPRNNILAGTAYLRAMYDRFGFPGMFAAYNAGPGRYEEHLRDARPLPPETLSYLKQMTEAGLSAADMDEFRRKRDPANAPDIPSGRSLFFLRNGALSARSDGEILVPLRSDRAGVQAG